LTFTADRRHPGLAGPRHWVRSSPDGRLLACLVRDDAGAPQLVVVSPCGGPLRQVTRAARGVESALSFSPDGARIACVIEGCVCVVDVGDGSVRRLTTPSPHSPPRPEACVFSPDGRSVAFARVVAGSHGAWTQICVTDA
jgi:Tol biopolymer transport system component